MVVGERAGGDRVRTVSVTKLAMLLSHANRASLSSTAAYATAAEYGNSMMAWNCRGGGAAAAVAVVTLALSGSKALVDDVDG